MSVPFPSPNARQVAPPSPACGKAPTKMFLEGGQCRVDRSAKVRSTKGEEVGG
ncbi:hypothetical protein EV714DRAFT_222647 [Schizophyllum commune]